ncbi:MAG: hypothetical protein NW237_12970 [Cyanobacteriota bacterium]|nr:hypothetical protein [Cyanobacteriota bacterium]
MAGLLIVGLFVLAGFLIATGFVPKPPDPGSLPASTPIQQIKQIQEKDQLQQNLQQTVNQQKQQVEAIEKSLEQP